VERIPSVLSLDALETVKDYERAYAIASEGLEPHPDNPSLHYQLACYCALAGRREDALRHFAVAVEGNPKVRDWAADDSDLDSIRSDL
jgi:tetratricopeptide (TPR) repeat protein